MRKVATLITIRVSQNKKRGKILIIQKKNKMQALITMLVKITKINGQTVYLYKLPNGCHLVSDMQIVLKPQSPM